MRALIAVTFGLLTLAVPLLAVAQTTHVLKAAKAKVTFPKGWKVSPYKISETSKHEKTATIDDILALKESPDCTEGDLGKAYKAVRGGNEEIRLVVVEYTHRQHAPQRLRKCILKAVGLPVRSVDWEDDQLQATAELEMNGAWTKGFISASFWKSCHPEYQAVAMIAVGPSSKSKSADSLLANIGFSRLPVDCSGMEFHLVCDRQNINCSF